MNCQANGDLCDKLGINLYPVFTFYANGEKKESHVGQRPIEELSKLVEQELEIIKPGSRPPGGVKAPEVGATGVSVTPQPDNLEISDPPAIPALDFPVMPDAAYGHGTEKDQKEKEPKQKEPKEKELKEKEPKEKEPKEKDHKEKDHMVHQKGPDASVSSDLAEATPSIAKPHHPSPNPQGVSIPLTAESFQRLVTTTQDPWFIKFYVPWCPFCQELAPNWQEMAKEMKNTLNVGEVDCEAEGRLCEEARVESFPTIHFFRGGQRVEYTGMRGLGDLLSYTRKAIGVGSSIEDVDADSFKELEETVEVLFLYFYDHATTTEDFKAMEQLTLSLVGHARMVKTDNDTLAKRFKISTWPRLLVVRDGRPNYYNALAPKDMRDVRQILSWMQTVWLPIVPELTVSNAREIMNGKYVVLGILSRHRSDDFKQSKRELQEAAFEWMDKQVQLFRLERSELRDAKQLRIEEADDRNDQRALRAAKNMRITIREDDKKAVAFAWVDGDFWERWLRTTYGIHVENGDRVIINDEDVSLIHTSIALYRPSRKNCF